MKLDADAILALITTWLTKIIGLGLLILILAAVLGKYGVRIPQLPSVQATDLAWLTGAWWLYRGGKLS